MTISVSKNSTIFLKDAYNLQHSYKDLVPFRCISLIHLFIVFTHKSPGIQSINIHSKLYCFHYNLLCCRKIGHKNLISIYSFVYTCKKMGSCGVSVYYITTFMWYLLKHFKQNISSIWWNPKWNIRLRELAGSTKMSKEMGSYCLVGNFLVPLATQYSASI